jgi:hypothetical protein
VEDRNIGEVIEKMMAVFPESESNVRHGLRTIMESIRYTAPEGMYNRWNQLGYFVNQVLPHPSQLNQWQRKFANEFTGRDVTAA